MGNSATPKSPILIPKPVTSPMHILVTGGGGFLGRYICEQLIARGDQVRSFGRGSYPELETIGVEVVHGDLRDAEKVSVACRGIDCVIHSAALAGIGLKPHRFEQTNVLGTENILAACREHDVERLVYTSSPSVTFSGQDQRGVDESAPYPAQWLAHYPRTKALAEQSVLASDHPRSCALRPHLIWGPRDGHLIPRLLARARSGRLRRVGDGTNLVDITYVENAAAGHLLAVDALAKENSPLTGKAYFLSQGEPVNCWKWIDQVLHLAGLPGVNKEVSLEWAWRIGTVCEAAYRFLSLEKEPPMTRFLASQLATSHWFDLSAARRDFGYEPKISTAEGMRRLGEWLKEPSA